LNCKQAGDIAKHFDREMDEAEKIQFMDHIDHCEACKSEYLRMQEILSETAACGEAEPPHNFEYNVMHKINLYELQKKEKNTRLLVALYNAATVFSVLFLVIFTAGMNREILTDVYNRMIAYFNSFTGIADAVFGVLKEVFLLLGGVASLIYEVGISVYYTNILLFAGLVALLVAVQQLFKYVVANDGRKSR